MQERRMSIEDAAAFLGVPSGRIAVWAASRQLPGQEMEGVWTFDAPTLEGWSKAGGDEAIRRSEEIDLDALAETLHRSGAVAGVEDETWLRATIRAPHGALDHPRLPAIALPLVLPAGDPADGPVKPEITLLAPLGRGGMGEVWLAEQRSLRRSVAVKLPLGSDPRNADALLEEARVTGNLDHPNIVPVHALGLSEDGRPVLVMKRVTGSTLQAIAADAGHPAWSDLLARHGDRETAIVDTLERAADALAFAHARGIVHRDLKPENIMVGAYGEVFVMDWGCAVAVRAPGPHALAGTPAFMAPEMVATGGTIDPRTDVYLLGATLHAALTGRPRHTGTTLAEVFAQVLASRQVDYGDEVSPSLAEVCNRATQADPSARFVSASAFRAALAHALRLRSMTDLLQRIATSANLSQTAEAGSGRATRQRLEEARHALLPVVAAWPEEQEPRALLDRVLGALARVALDEQLIPLAEEAARALHIPDPELSAAVAKARMQQAEAAELAARAERDLQERDARPSIRGMLWMAGFMLLNAVMLVSAISMSSEPLMRDVVLTDLASLAVLAVAAFVFRTSLLANHRGRITTAAIWFVLLAMCLCDGLGAFAGLSARATAPFSLLSAATGFAALAVLLEMRRGPRIVLAGCSALLCAEAFWSAALPDLATRLMALSVVQTALTGGYVIYDMTRESRDGRGNASGQLGPTR
jgi:eukaryotic-like serine/threonine-protein kinase